MTDSKSLKYTKDHEWLKIEGSVATVGITDFAQSELGDLVFVDLPKIGSELKRGDVLCVVESTKAASDVYAPISGRVAEVNSSLEADPQHINLDPYGQGWIAKLEGIDAAETGDLMSEDEYKTHLG